MKRKIFTLSLLTILLASCSNTTTNPSNTSSSNPESTSTSSEVENISITKTLNSKVYIAPGEDGTAKDGIDLPTEYFSSTGDVPYVSLNDFVTFMNHLSDGEGDLLKLTDGTINNEMTNSTIVFDVSRNTIHSEDLDQAVNFTDTPLPMDVFCSETSKIVSYDAEHSSYTKGNAMTFNLADFKSELISYNNSIYVPYSFIANIYLSDLGMILGFNGDDYYHVNLEAMLDMEKSQAENRYVLNGFGNSYYNGSYSKITSRSKSFSEYFYYSFLFQMTYFNGKFPTLNTTSLDDTLSKTKFKLNETETLKEAMLSEDSEKADSALACAVDYVFHDGGHTSFSLLGSSCPFDIEANNNLTGCILDADSRYTAGYTERLQLTQDRTNKQENKAYSIEGNTAVIRFDSFSDSPYLSKEYTASEYPTKEEVMAEIGSQSSTSTFATLYYGLNRLYDSYRDTVKNVVIDLSINGGGEAVALGYALSFMTDDPVTVSIKNPITGAKFTQSVNIDNDLDPTTQNDSFAGKFNFYILTSKCSFSCGNAMPCIAKDNGYATIIGETSGGGDCVVSHAVSVEGSTWQMSGTSMIVDKNGNSVDTGAAVDHEYPIADFYDMKKLNTFINSLSSNN